jgi:hypothetical protein
LGAGQLAIELVGGDHHHVCLGASTFGSLGNGLFHPLLPLESSGIACFDMRHMIWC